MEYPTQSPADKLIAFWRVLYGGGPGYMCIFLATRTPGRGLEHPANRFFRWPEQAETGPSPRTWPRPRGTSSSGTNRI